MSSKQLILELFYNGKFPLCKCGCGETLKYFIPGKNRFAEWVKGHIARVNNPTRDNPEIAKRAISKANKIHCEGLKSGEIQQWNKGLTKEDNQNLASKYKGKKIEEFMDTDTVAKVKQSASDSIKKRAKEDPNFNAHMKEYWSKEENREKQRKRHVDWLLSVENKLKTSKAEELYESLLVKYNIIYTKQVRIKNKLFDFKIDNTLIEIDGDFHHVNPRLYPKGAKYQIQIKTIANDEIKNQIAKELGYTLKRIWYSDLQTLVKENREAETLP